MGSSFAATQRSVVGRPAEARRPAEGPPPRSGASGRAPVARAVVLLLAHSEEGAFGLVVNRPAEAEGLPWPVFDGGPCPSPGLRMLHGHAGWASAGDAPEGENVVREAGRGIFVGDAACLE